MLNRAQLKIKTEEVEGLNDDFMFRLLAIKMVKEIPMKELHKLMKFSKLDPHNFDVHTNLFEEKVIILEVEVTLPDYE